MASFDSCGWLYLYQLGVARYLELHVLPQLGDDGCVYGVPRSDKQLLHISLVLV